jgi:hypothetical protein
VAPADEVLWPLGTGAAGAHWATQAAERYLHMARIIMLRAAAWPAAEAPFSAQALDLARQLYDVIERTGSMHWELAAHLSTRPAWARR